MKIERFNENNYISSINKQVVADFSDAGYQGQPEFHIYDTEEQAFNFLLNKIYYFYYEHEFDLSKLDKCEDPVELIEEYENKTFKHQMAQEIFYTIIHSEELVELDNWVAIRRDAKKYNL